MHATFDDLLTLRDDAADSALSAHVRACAECRQQLARLRARTDALRRLPPVGSAPDRWDAIQHALHAPVVRVEHTPRHPGWLLPAASAAAVVLAVVVTLQSGGPQEDAGIDREVADVVVEQPLPDVDTAPVANAQNAARLIQESQRLEQLLASYPQAPRVTRASTELTVADLEDRIQWVDYRLNQRVDSGLDEFQAQRLWRERVELLNSLVAVRYAQARTSAF
jgi:hypothetical protein